MEDRPAAWVLEFLLRQPAVDDWVVSRLISILPVADDDLRLKQAILLRALRSEVSRTSLSEWTLILLESFQSLDRSGSAALSDSARVAYCAMAVEATAKYLRDEPPNFEEFVCAVDRVWKARVAELEAREEWWRGLGSDTLTESKKEMMAAVGNERIREGVVAKATRRHAVEAVGAFLEAAEKELGPTFLESAAEALLCGRLRDKVASPANTMALDDDDMTLPPSGTDTEIQPSTEGNAAVKDVIHITEEADANLAGEISHAAHQGPSTRRDCTKYDPLPTPGVKKILDALISSSKDLKSIVEDPLPEALEVITNMQSIHEADLTDKACLKENQNVIDGDQQVASLENGVEAIHEAATTYNQHETNQEGRSWPGFNARNPTARTYEWSDDSPTKDSPGCSRIVHLPSPRKRVVSPLKIAEAQKFVRRRSVKRWSTLEEDTLRDAVREYGRGNWKVILSKYRGIFEDRTEVDLKDKWRNMVR